MFIHLLKLIWNRKRANGLIIAEVAIAFVMIFAVAVLGFRNYFLYQIPLGYDYDNMWRLQVIGSGEWKSENDGIMLNQLFNAVKQLPEVQQANLMANPTFRNWTSTRTIERDGNIVYYYLNSIDDNAGTHFGIRLLEGRWFSPQDSNQNYDAVLINKKLAEDFFPNQTALGQNIADIDRVDVNDEPPREQRVVGVFEDFRQFGELSPIEPYAFFRIDPDNIDRNYGIEIKLIANVDVFFEQRLLTLMKQMAPQYNYSFRAWSESRDTQLRQTMVPLSIFAVIATFLIFMVAMGLFGVLWQNVTTRTQELGLRRALGASAAGIHWQIITELLIVTLIGVMIAFIGIVQLPILGVFKELNWSLFWISFTSSLVFMIGLSLLCAFYPGKCATAFSPSEALHYE